MRRYTMRPWNVALALTIMLAPIAAIADPARAAFGAPVTVSVAGRDADNAQVAVNAAGNGVVAWRRYDGAHWRAQARTVSATGSLGVIQTLSDAGQDAGAVHVAVDATGAGRVVWQRFDGSRWR